MNVELNENLLNTLKQEVGEAYYILDSVQFRKNFLELKKAFSDIYPKFNIAYSYKTNYSPSFCKIVDELGGYAEVVSEMEMELALKIGVDAKNIIWNGPIKHPVVVEEFLLKGGVVNVDSMDELRFLREIVDKNPNRLFRFGIRCNYDVNDGVISRFGFDVDSKDFEDVLFFVCERENVKLVNLQCHFAKRQIEYWPARAKGMIDLIKRIGIVPERIDLGGALFGKMDESLKKQFSTDIPEYSDYANAAATLFANEFGNDGPELIIEPGSALVGDCMKFVGTVKTIKCVRGKYFASILGSQKNISMSGVNPPIKIYSGGGERKYYDDVDLVGFTCIEGDVIHKNYSGELAVGDCIVISNCGSYSLVMKPPFILPNFPVVDINHGNIDIVKRAETFEDVFQTFLF